MLFCYNWKDYSKLSSLVGRKLSLKILKQGILSASVLLPFAHLASFWPREEMPQRHATTLWTLVRPCQDVLVPRGESGWSKLQAHKLKSGSVDNSMVLLGKYCKLSQSSLVPGKVAHSDTELINHDRSMLNHQGILPSDTCFAIVWCGMQLKADVDHAAHHTYVIDMIIETHVTHTHRDTVRLSECNLTLCTKKFAPQNLEQRQTESHIVQWFPFSHWPHSMIFYFRRLSGPSYFGWNIPNSGMIWLNRCKYGSIAAICLFVTLWTFFPISRWWCCFYLTWASGLLYLQASPREKIHCLGLHSYMAGICWNCSKQCTTIGGRQKTILKTMPYGLGGYKNMQTDWGLTTNFANDLSVNHNFSLYLIEINTISAGFRSCPWDACSWGGRQEPGTA